MFRVLNCLTVEHDWRLVGLAAVVCFLASLAAISLFHRARVTRGRVRALWLGTAGIATGTGIWATHFVAMLAYDPGTAVAYGVVLTAASWVAAVTVTTAGLSAAVYGPPTAAALFGGAVVGAGVAAMHYTGMAAVQLPGYIAWQTDLVVVSIALGMAFGMAALWTAIRSDDARATLLAAALLTLAIVSHHFTAMGAVDVVADPSRVIDPLTMAGGSLALIVAAAAVALLGMCLIAAIGDRRSDALVREQVVRLDRAINNMVQGLSMYDAGGRLLVCNGKYREIYRLSDEIAKPGRPFREIAFERAAKGTLNGDPEQYCSRVLPILLNAKAPHRVVEQVAGRTISISSQPMPGGGWVAIHEDITDRQRSERELERTRKFLDTIVENIPATLVVKRASDLRYVLINRAGEELLGASREDLIGKTVYDYFGKHDADRIMARDRFVVASGDKYSEEALIHTKPGGPRQVMARRVVVPGDDGKPEYLLSVVEDITERKRAEERIVHLAHHDPLTDLPNRAAFSERLSQCVERAAAARETFAILCIDLDRFKEVNDVFGHGTGDVLLREVAGRLRAATEGQYLARLGGDEFTLIVEGGEQPTTAAAVADRIMTAVGGEFQIEGQSLRAGLSIGVAIYPTDGRETETLLSNADAALYRAKAEGRGSIRFFEAQMDTRLRERRSLQHDLRTALDRSELALHYQPQARIDGEIVGFEALLRWEHPTRGSVPPSTFIPIAEESGLIVQLGEWVLREACREAASWPKPLQIAINLSPVQFRHGDLPGLVHGILLESGLSPRRLELEITESVLIGDLSRAVSILRRLKAMGVKIAMDDFGTGYSSLSYLQSFPFDKIKIDRAFISNLDRNPQSVAIVRAVLGLGRGLDLPVVAEGVETKEQLAFLAREACDEVQGFLFGRPSPIDTYAAIVGRDRIEQRVAAAG